MIRNDVARWLARTIAPKPAAEAPEVSGGTVTRVDVDGTVWVQLFGSEDETPCATKTAAAKPGDVVTVTIDGGRAWVDGNVSAPATDDSVAIEAHELAAQAIEDVQASTTQTYRRIADVSGIADEADRLANATNQHFFADDGGIHVTEAEGDPTTEHNILINSLGMLLRYATNYLVSITQSATAFYDGLGNASSNLMAYFGRDGFQVGRDAESHLVGDYHSLRLVDRDGETYFWVSDLRGQDGKYHVEEPHIVYTQEAHDNWVQLKYPPDPTSSLVLKCGDTVLDVSSVQSVLVFLANPDAVAVGSILSATYITADIETKVYTLGNRMDVDPVTDIPYFVGPKSYVLGHYCVASSFAAHAEGWTTQANGISSHAEGTGTLSNGQSAHAEGESTTADGMYSHSEGHDTVAGGDRSHAQNYGTKASSDGQTAMGRYNVEDANDIYALIIGNGTSNSSRSNAFAVKWTGEVVAATPLPIASGGTGTTAFGTIVQNDISTAYSLANATTKSIGSITLTEGTWIIRFGARFDANATGRRNASISTTADSTSTAFFRYGAGATANAVSGGSTTLNGSLIRTITATGDKTFYLTVYQNSGGALDVTGMLQAIRIK